MKYNKDQQEFLSKIGANIGKHRKKKKLSFRGLSQRCDIDFADLNRIEKGLRNITLLTAMELCRGLDIHPKELFEFEMPEKSEEEPPQQKSQPEE